MPKPTFYVEIDVDQAPVGLIALLLEEVTGSLWEATVHEAAVPTAAQLVNDDGNVVGTWGIR